MVPKPVRIPSAQDYTFEIATRETILNLVCQTIISSLYRVSRAGQLTERSCSLDDGSESVIHALQQSQQVGLRHIHISEEKSFLSYYDTWDGCSLLLGEHEQCTSINIKYRYRTLRFLE